MSRPPVPTAASDRVRTIAPGVEIPLPGLGVLQLVKGDEGERAIVAALQAGYRHTAARRRTSCCAGASSTG